MHVFKVHGAQGVSLAQCSQAAPALVSARELDSQRHAVLRRASASRVNTHTHTHTRQQYAHTSILAFLTSSIVLHTHPFVVTDTSVIVHQPVVPPLPALGASPVVTCVYRGTHPTYCEGETAVRREQSARLTPYVVSQAQAPLKTPKRIKIVLVFSSSYCGAK